jgi:cation transport ATPase
MQKKFKVEVDCANCAAKIEDAINRLPNVSHASLSFMTQKLILDAPDPLFDETLRAAVKAAKKVEPDFEIEL